MRCRAFWFASCFTGLSCLGIQNIGGKMLGASDQARGCQCLVAVLASYNKARDMQVAMSWWRKPSLRAYKHDYVVDCMQNETVSLEYQWEKWHSTTDY